MTKRSTSIPRAFALLSLAALFACSALPKRSRTARAEPMARIQAVLISLISAVLLVPACSSSGFECGTPLESDPDLTYTCGRPEERCICSTRSCARPEHPEAEAKEPCKSGLRYVSEEDFVTASALAGACVDEAHVDSAIVQQDAQSRCPGSPALAAGTSSGASSGTTVADTDTSTTTATTTTATTTTATDPAPTT